MVIADNRQVVAEAGQTRQRGAVRVEIDAHHGFPDFDFLSPDDNLMWRPEAMITNQDTDLVRRYSPHSARPSRSKPW